MNCHSWLGTNYLLFWIIIIIILRYHLGVVLALLELDMYRPGWLQIHRDACTTIPGLEIILTNKSKTKTITVHSVLILWRISIFSNLFSALYH